ncbi:hypothetical protein MHK_005220, partial [Candidatus Magnetomorum sp. HK-1]
EYMVSKRKIILMEINESNSTPKAWEILKEKIPELSKLIKLNTFKGYVKTLIMIDKIMDKNEKIKQEKDELVSRLVKNMEEKKELEIKLSKAKNELEELGTVRQENKKLKKRLDEVRQKREAVSSELYEVRQEKMSLESRLDKVRQNKQRSTFLTSPEKKIKGDNISNRFEGWGVQLKGNYYRLFKKIEGKVKWIHIGKKWDENLAKKKVEEFKKNKEVR